MNIITTGNRIHLCKPSVDLCASVLEAILESQNELAEYLPWVESSLTEQSTFNNMLQAIENYESFQDELRMAIVDKNTGRFLGMTGLIIHDQSIPYFEIGYWLRTSEVGQGYIAEAVKMVEDYAFTELKALRIDIKAVESNSKSIAVAKRCGFKFEALLEQSRRLPNGKIDGTVIYRKLANEYREQ